MDLSRPQARALMLAAQGLLTPPTQAATKAAVLAAIQRMAILQIDTINVVARSPYLVLWSRLGAYETRWLDELLAEGAIFEYWSHEASFLPSEQYPLYRRTQLAGLARNWTYVQNYATENAAPVAAMLDHIRANGPVRSADFVRVDGVKGSWWNWKTEKRVLEHLFTTGELMITRRDKFQRIYDLRERVLPAWNDGDAPPLAAVHRAFALATVQALGVTTARWLADYFRIKKQNSARLLAQLAAEGAVLPANIEGFAEPAYVHPANQALAEQAASGALVPTLTTLLSPFDPIVWDRRRALELFGFDYRIECYTPAAKRRYGYFTLPILWRGELVGRLDPKAHRKTGIFEIKALHFEPGIPITAELRDDIMAAIQRCADWHGTPEVRVAK